MLDLSKNYCYDRILIEDLKSLYNNIQLWKTPDKKYVYSLLSDELQVQVDKIEIGFGTIDIVERVLSLFDNKTVTSIGPYWAGIKWACEKTYLKFDDKNGDIAYIARPNGRDGLLRDIDFDDYVDLYEYFAGDVYTFEKETKYKHKIGPKKGVIIDEAYGDFCDDTFLHYTHNKSIVIKTFSKSLSIPGLRFAYSVSNEGITERIRKLSHPYSLNVVAQDFLPDAFRLISPHIERMKQTKFYIEQLFEHLPSFSNFVRILENPPYDIKIPKINNYYRFTLVDMETLASLRHDL